mgnify:CR=1 FL=1
MCNRWQNLIVCERLLPSILGWAMPFQRLPMLRVSASRNAATRLGMLWLANDTLSLS